MKSTEIDVPRLINYWLFKCDMTKTELSNRMNVTKGRVSHLLGKKNIRTDILSRLAVSFGVSPSEFIKPAETKYK